MLGGQRTGVGVTGTDLVNFRTRTGQARRARTRRRILEAAFDLFDERGVGRVTVDQVREAAGLSRGSFYNYFATYESMLIDIAGAITRQINREQSEYFDGEVDVARRMFQTMRYFLSRAASDRACSEVLIRVVPLVGAPTVSMHDHARGTMLAARQAGLIDVDNPEIALEVSFGMCSAILRREVMHGVDAQEISTVVLMVLRSLGMSAEAMDALKSAPMVKLPGTPLRESVIAGDED